MNRRKFFGNLVVSVGTLVAAYATPVTRISVVNLKRDPDYLVAILFKRELEAIGSQMKIRHFPRSPWIDLVSEGTFPENMGKQ